MHRHVMLALVAALVCGLIVAGMASASGLGSYGLPWNVLGSGGGRTSSSSYALGATLGQAGIGLSGSAGHEVRAGYWYGLGPALPAPLFLPLILLSWSG